MNIVLILITMHLLNRFLFKSKASVLIQDEIFELEAQREQYKKASGLKTKEQESWYNGILEKEDSLKHLLEYIKILGL